MKRAIITVTGLAGTGTSTAAKNAAQKLLLSYWSSGDHFRKIAQERGISLPELVELAKTDASVDDLIDGTIKELGKGRGYAIDSRIAYHFIPDSFKVRLHASPEATAQRIYAQLVAKDRISESAESLEEVLAANERRRVSDRERYLGKYGVDLEDVSGFDLEIDTGVVGIEEMTELICARYRAWLQA